MAQYPKPIAATTVIPFDNPVTLIPPKTITGPITFSKSTTNAQAGYCTIIRVTANGTNIPDLSAFATIGTGAWDNTAGVVNQLWFVYDGTQYCVAITHPVGGTTLPQLSTPSAFTATPSGSSANLSWSDVANEIAYKVYWSGVNDFSSAGLATTTAANATTYTKTGLSNGPWYFWVVAVGDGTTYSDSNPASASATVSSGATQLSTPTLTATVISSSEIDLSWTNVANESSYKLEWSPNGTSGWTQIGGTIAANTTTYNHTGLTASTHYYYRVTAVGDGTTFTDSNYGTDDDTTSAAGYDADATTVINAIEATDAGALSTGQKNAINARILALKAQSKWTNMVAYYGYVGGTAASHAINWKSPGTFDITWHGTQTHSATGVLFDGSTGYGDTGINDNTVMNLDTFSIGGYSRTSTNNGFMMGILQTNGVYLADRNSMIVRMHDVADLTAAMTPTRTLMATRQVSAPKLAEYRDVSQLTVDAGAALGKINGNIYVGAINNLNTPGPGGFSDKSYGSMFISNDGFTSSEEATFGADETTFQTALSRNV
jgi:hypothetical protein